MWKEQLIESTDSMYAQRQTETCMPLVIGTRKIISRGVKTSNKPMARRIAKPGFDLIHIHAGIKFGSEEDFPKLTKLDSEFRHDKQD